MPSAIVLLMDEFEEIEALSIIDILRRAGIETTTVGVGSNLLKSAQGVKVYSDIRFLDLEGRKYDALILPGGRGFRNLLENYAVINLVKDAYRAGKVIAAICGSPLVLEKAGILKDKRATIYPGMEKLISRPRDGKVVIDENIITSKGPGTAIEFGLAIVEHMLGRIKADKIRAELVA